MLVLLCLAIVICRVLEIAKEHIVRSFKVGIDELEGLDVTSAEQKKNAGRRENLLVHIQKDKNIFVILYMNISNYNLCWYILHDRTNLIDV